MAIESLRKMYPENQLLLRKKCPVCKKLLSIQSFLPYKWNFDFINEKINSKPNCGIRGFNT